MPINERHWRLGVFCEYDLVVMAVYQDTRNAVLLLDLEGSVMFIDDYPFRWLGLLLLHVLPVGPIV